MTELMKRRRALMTIQNQGGDGEMAWINNVSKINAFSLEGATISDDIVLDFSDKPVSGLSFKNVTIVNSNTVIEVKCGTLSFAQACCSSFNNQNTNAYTLKLSCENNPTAGTEMTRASTCTRIIGKPMVATGFNTGTYRQFNSTKLVEFYLVPNRVETGGDGITTGILIDDSIVSVANALKGGLATQQTLKIANATTKGKLNTIVGTVSTVTEDGSTYDFFTQDSSGTVTLYDFITQTKGWVIA